MGVDIGNAGGDEGSVEWIVKVDRTKYFCWILFKCNNNETMLTTITAVPTHGFFGLLLCWSFSRGFLLSKSGGPQIHLFFSLAGTSMIGYCILLEGGGCG